MAAWRAIITCADFILGTYGRNPDYGILRSDLNIRFFYKHPLLQKYEWYWRLEPDIKYFCDIT